MDAGVAWAAVGGVGSVVSAAVAAWAARQSRVSAREANAAANALAAIERERRHDELAPEFEVTLTLPDPDSDTATLLVSLKRGRLERLDEVTITIQDEAGVKHWADGLPEGVTRDEAAAFIWGPWEFAAGTSDAVSNRTSQADSYSVVTGTTWGVFTMQRTRPGHWMTGTSQQDWRARHQGRAVRLLLTCVHDGERWQVPLEAEPTVKAKGRIRVIG